MPSTEVREVKNCPQCGEEILAVAVKCKHCKSRIGPGADLEKKGKEMQSVGCGMVFLITIPILILMFVLAGC